MKYSCVVVVCCVCVGMPCDMASNIILMCVELCVVYTNVCCEKYYSIVLLCCCVVLLLWF